MALRPAGIGRARTVERVAGLRRHDDLGEIGEEQRSRAGDAGQGDGELAAIRPDQSVDADAVDPYGFGAKPHPGRSEEHTSELQSLMRISYAVFCLKQKKKINTKPQRQIYS